MKRLTAVILALLLALLAAGCRVRTGLDGEGDYSSATDGAPDNALSDETALDGALPLPEQSGDGGEDGGLTRENPEAQRREYDESAPVEVVPGTNRALHGPGEGEGAPQIDPEAQAAGSILDDDASDAATQTVDAEKADDLGASPDAEEADSAMTYYTALLSERSASLFECQRQSVYYETDQDHVTVFKTSLEHDLITGAGAVDVSGRLLEENLTVDDGWVARKNPGVIIKAMSGGMSPGEAEWMYSSLLSREGWDGIDAVKNGRVALFAEELLEDPRLQTFVMLLIAKTADESLYSDVDLDEALSSLMVEVTGSQPTGIYYYTGAEG